MDTPQTERSTVQLVVWLIGILAIILVTGLIGLLFLERDVPEGVYTLTGGLVGALSAMLVSTRSVVPEPRGRKSVGKLSSERELPVPAPEGGKHSAVFNPEHEVK